MIVKCDQCQTRFKIPDEKVTERGVKVRCTKCQNTFRVKKAASGDEAARIETGPGDFNPLESGPSEVKIPAPTPAPPPARAPSRAATPAARPTAKPVQPAAAPAPIPDAGDFLFDVPGSEPVSPPDFSSPAEAPPAEAPPAEALPSGGIDFGGLDFSSPPGALAFGSSPSSAEFPGSLGDSAEPKLDLFGSPSSPEPAFASTPAAEPPPATDSSGLFSDLGEMNEGSTPLQFDAEARKELFGDTAPPNPKTAPAKSARPPPAIPPAPPRALPVPTGPVEKPIKGRPDDVGIDSRPPGAARRVGAVLVNIALAGITLAALVMGASVYFNEGKLDASALQLEWLQPTSGRSELVAHDISNGLYETRSGRSVFFVRGEVENRSAARRRARVKAELFDGSNLVSSAQALVGAVPTPEELHGLDSPEDVEKLTARLNGQALELNGGQRLSFVLTFYEYPPDLSSFRLKVTVEDVAAVGVGKGAAR
jgi:predicted Zn finger-like uncharacterized protein